MFSLFTWYFVLVALTTTRPAHAEAMPTEPEPGGGSDSAESPADWRRANSASTTVRAKLVRQALESYPAIAAANLQTRAARGEPASGLSPLQIEAGAAPLSFGAPEMGVKVGARWAIPALGMQRLQREQLGWAAEASFAQERMLLFEVAARASVALDRYVAARERLAALTQHAEGFIALEAAIDRRLAAGLATSAAKTMAQMEAAKASAAVFVGRRELSQAEAELRAVVGEIDLSALSGELGPVLIGQQAGVPGGAPNEERPAVKMAQADAAMAETMSEMAARTGRPMIEIMGEYSTMWADPMHMLMVGAMVSVPLDTRVRSLRTGAARDRQLAASSVVEAEQREATRLVDDARAMLDETAAMVRLAQDRMFPLATEAARIARTNWEGGTGTLLEYLRAEQERVQAQSMVATSLADQRQAEAMYAMVTGQFAGIPAQRENE